MAGNNIVVGMLRAVLTADTAEFESGLRKASGDATKFGKDLQSFGSSVGALGSALLPLSAAVAGIGAMSVSTAIEFESSFAGIRKTVDDATDDFGNLTDEGRRLEQGMRDLAQVIPVGTEELNNIGAAAGQLGIETPNILEFTRVMADLGVTTNLTSEQAAQALARFGNITQMPQENFDRLGSTIVALGNNMATTEAEITEFGLRIAGAGAQIGLTEAQILAIGAALSSVGINAEAGGTAISKVMIDMASSVELGGARLAQFAAVAGMTASEFKQKFETDAAGALVAFITGLGNMEGRGTSTLAVLDAMGLSEVRLRDALLRSSGAGDLLAESIQLGTAAWIENTALTKEAEQRYRTTASQLTLLWNNLKDVALTIGQAMLPALSSLMEMFRGWIPAIEKAAKWFAELSPGIRTAMIVIGGLVAALAPALIALGAMATAIGAAMPVLTAVGGAIAAFVTGPIGLIVAAVVGLALAWYKWGDDVTRVVTETFQAAKQWLVDMWEGSIFQSVARMLGAMAELFFVLHVKAGEYLLALFTTAKDYLLDKFAPLIDAVTATLDLLGTAWAAAKDLVVGTVAAIYDGIKTWILDKFGAIVDAVKGKVDAVTEAFKWMREAIVGSSERIAPAVVSQQNLEKATTGTATATTTATTALQQQSQTLTTRVMPAVHLTTEKVTAAAKAMAEWSRETSLNSGEMVWMLAKLQPMPEAIESMNASQFILVGTTHDLTDAMNALPWAKIQTGASDTVHAADRVKGAWGSVVDGFKEGMDALWKGMSGDNGFHGLMKNLGKGIVDGFGQIISGGMTSVINAAVGLAIEGAKKIGSAIAGLFKSEETKKVNKPRDEFFAQYGGYEGLAQKLDALGMAPGESERLIKAVFAADTEKEFHAAEDAIIALIGGNKFKLGTPNLGFMDFGAGQLAMLHGEEAVVPKEAAGAFAARYGNNQVQVIQIYQDGMLTTSRVVRNMPRVLALHGVG